MSGYYNNPEDHEDVDTNSGGGLRKQLEEALTEIRSLKTQLASDSTAKQTASATELLQGKGEDPVLLSLVPEGTNPLEWAEKYLGLKGQGAEGEPAPIDQPEVVAASDDDPALVAEREALAAMQEAAETGSPSAVVSNDLIQQMGKIDNEEDFLKFLRENG